MPLFNKYKIGDVVVWLFVFTIFSRRSYIDFGFLGVDVYAYGFFLIALVLLSFKVRAVVNFIYAFVAFLAYQLLLKFFLGYGFLPLFKQIVPIFFVFLVSYSLFLRSRDYRYIFEVYAVVAYWLALFGLLQFALSSINIHVLLRDPLRLNSISPEPSHYVVVVFPAFVYHFLVNGLKDRRTIVLLISQVLTFSIVFYALLALFLIFSVRHSVRRWVVYVVPIALIVGFSVKLLGADRFSGIIMRWEDLISVNNGDQSIAGVNLTVYSVMSNLNVAIYSLQKSLFLGSALGGHPESYDEYVAHAGLSRLSGEGINKEGAHSTWIRILSELGVPGLIVFLWLIYKYRVVSRDRGVMAISYACLFYFVARAFKLGGYFDHGLYFFVFSYYFASKEGISKKSEMR